MVRDEWWSGMSGDQAFAIQALIARFDSRFDSAENLKIRFNSIFQKILDDFFSIRFLVATVRMLLLLS